MSKNKPILCLDFDGVLHSYTSGWQGADVVPDPPTPGAMAFLLRAIEQFDVQIYSSRSSHAVSSGNRSGIAAMKSWIIENMMGHLVEVGKSRNDAASLAIEIVSDSIGFPTAKPPAMVTLDDRALTFTGTFPDVDKLMEFKPWNR